MAKNPPAEITPRDVGFRHIASTSPSSIPSARAATPGTGRRGLHRIPCHDVGRSCSLRPTTTGPVVVSARSRCGFVMYARERVCRLFVGSWAQRGRVLDLISRADICQDGSRGSAKPPIDRLEAPTIRRPTGIPTAGYRSKTDFPYAPTAPRDAMPAAGRWRSRTGRSAPCREREAHAVATTGVAWSAQTASPHYSQKKIENKKKKSQNRFPVKHADGDVRPFRAHCRAGTHDNGVAVRKAPTPASSVPLEGSFLPSQRPSSPPGSSK